MGVVLDGNIYLPGTVIDFKGKKKLVEKALGLIALGYLKRLEDDSKEENSG
jgi:hypothetical protein